jgi:hypothetical protein
MDMSLAVSSIAAQGHHEDVQVRARAQEPQLFGHPRHHGIPGQALDDEVVLLQARPGRLAFVQAPADQPRELGLVQEHVVAEVVADQPLPRHTPEPERQQPGVTGAREGQISREVEIAGFTRGSGRQRPRRERPPRLDQPARRQRETCRL